MSHWGALQAPSIEQKIKAGITFEIAFYVCKVSKQY
jgi:hypothetical protein